LWLLGGGVPFVGFELCLFGGDTVAVSGGLDCELEGLGGVEADFEGVIFGFGHGFHCAVWTPSTTGWDSSQDKASVLAARALPFAPATTLAA
jgi:hypothetical protein